MAVYEKEFSISRDPLHRPRCRCKRLRSPLTLMRPFESGAKIAPIRRPIQQATNSESYLRTFILRKRLSGYSRTDSNLDSTSRRESREMSEDGGLATTKSCCAPSAGPTTDEECGIVIEDQFLFKSWGERSTGERMMMPPRYIQ